MLSLYERIGGKTAVSTAVDIFYKKVLADPDINHFFEGVDMETQKAKQKAFLTVAFGGAENYSGKNLREGHKHLVEQGLNDHHFDQVALHLKETLETLDVANDIIQEVMELVGSTRDDVLNRPAAAA